MTAPAADFYYDFLDPLSYLVGQELARLDPAETVAVRWRGTELRPPPTPLTTLDDPELTERWRESAGIAAEMGVTFSPPALVPWSRKAHEMVLHADEAGAVTEVRMRIFESYLLEGLDIGRVDVLVRVAREAGLDASEAKAVLDVDRFEALAAESTMNAREAGITVVPTLVREGKRLEGFHNRSALGTFLRR